MAPLVRDNHITRTVSEAATAGSAVSEAGPFDAEWSERLPKRESIFVIAGESDNRERERNSGECVYIITERVKAESAHRETERDDHVTRSCSDKEGDIQQAAR